jgi:tetratricopeptide (TPR) repeat protein
MGRTIATKLGYEHKHNSARAESVAALSYCCAHRRRGWNGSALFVTSRQAPSSTLVPIDAPNNASAASTNAVGTNANGAASDAPSANTPVVSGPVVGAQSPSEVIAAAGGESAAVALPPADLTSGMTPAQAAVTLGNWHFDHKNFTQAIVDYRKAIALGLDNPDVRTDLGSALRFSDQPQEALKQYQFAQKQNPLHENSLYNQGGLFFNEQNRHLVRRDPAYAASIWREYLKRFPQGRNVSAARQLLAAAQSQPGVPAQTPKTPAKTR